MEQAVEPLLMFFAIATCVIGGLYICVQIPMQAREVWQMILDQRELRTARREIKKSRESFLSRGVW